MAKDKIMLKDGTAIEVGAMTSIGDVTVHVADLAAAQALKDKLTPDNLSAVETHNGDGLTVGQYADQVLEVLTADLLTAEGIDVKLGLRDKTETEKLRDEMLASQAVQDGAIADMGAALSDMAEGGAQ